MTKASALLPLEFTFEWTKKKGNSAVKYIQDWMKISSRISLLFKSKGTKQRGSPITRVCQLLPAFHFWKELNLVKDGGKKKSECVPVRHDRWRGPNQWMSLKEQRWEKVLIFNVTGVPESGLFALCLSPQALQLTYFVLSLPLSHSPLPP